MLFFKGCPKCLGDMYVDRDVFGTFIECLQCGYLRDVERRERSNGDSTPQPVGEAITRLGRAALRVGSAPWGKYARRGEEPDVPQTPGLCSNISDITSMIEVLSGGK